MMLEKEKIVNARKINKMRCITGLILCSLVVVLTLVALLLNVANAFDEEVTPEGGLKTLRMFTTLSNIIAAVAASICIPFQIDGLRKNKYKLPFWIVTIMYIGVVGVFITFVIALTAISIAQGFVPTMFMKSNIFMHTLNPIFITLLLTLFISDHRISFKESLLAMIPITIYALIYFIMVFVAKVWRDHYETNTFIPWPMTLIIILAVSFGSTQLIRYLHNLTNKNVTLSIKKYYEESDDYDFDTITDAIAHLAREEARFYHEGDDIYIPTDIIKLLSERYKASSLPLDIQYDIYLERYLEQIQKSPENN